MFSLSHRARRLLRAALLPCTLVPLLGGAAPASAGEMPIHHYSVLVEGEADYFARDESCCGASGGIHWHEVDTKFTWDTELSDLPFYDKKPISAASVLTGVFVHNARATYHLDNRPPDDGECTGHDVEVQGASIHGLPESGPDGSARLRAKVLEGIEIGLPNC